MSPVSTRFLIASALACAGLIAPAAALAQPAPSATPAAQPTTPAAPPPWQQGRPAEQSDSTLHPFAPQMTGRAASGLPIDKLKVPAGFKVEVWVDGVPEARSLALGDKGTVFVSNRLAKNVYAVVDRDGKREVKTLLKGLNAPNGIAFNKGTLYVAERHRITRYDGIEDKLDNPPEGKVVVDNLDPSRAAGHFWKFLAMGPDGKLYFNIGAPCNICLPPETNANISRINADGTGFEYVARGVRNSVGFDWHPVTKELYFTNHGRDWLGEDVPNDTLHQVSGRNVPHFGYPYCHQGDILDPDFGKGHACSEFNNPLLKLGPHIAPIGTMFYTGSMFPAEYKNRLFIVQRGSWNRTEKLGYGITTVTLAMGQPPKQEGFASGWLESNKPWGRPAYLYQMPDGSLLLSDDYNGAIYHITYSR